MGIDQKIDAFFKPFADALSAIIFYAIPVMPGVDAKLVLILLGGAAIFFTFYLGFINIRYFGHAIAIARGKFDRGGDKGEVSSFQAMMASLAGTVGLGNIAGVAVAISLGGPGAAFWMTLMGFLCMSSKFAEVTMGFKYRRHTSDEHPDALSGGPMYYLSGGLAARGFPRAGRLLAAVFAVCCIAGCLGGGNMFQANQTFKQVYIVTGGDAGFLAGQGWLFGVALGLLTGAVIIGGIKSIANASSAIVPVMAFVYLVAGAVVIGVHYESIPSGLATIFREAFTPQAGIAGILGSALIGIQRAAFSNEAGLGTAAIVYAAAKGRHPVTQGMASMIGPFIDTCVICLMSALMIVISGAYVNGSGIEGVELTSRAMESAVSWFPYVLAFTVFLFAYSTLITCYYYAEKCLTYLIGDRDAVVMGLKVFYCLCVVIGSAASLENLIAMTDALFLSMAIPNVIGLFILAPEIKRELNDYIARLKAGEQP